MTLARRARTIDLDNPFTPSLEGMCELLLVRHGEQSLPHNVAVGDALDPPLSEQGERQVAAVAERLSPTRIDAIYSSPLVRALRTGQAIGERHGIVPVPVDELREFDPWARFPQDKGMFDVLGKEGVAEIFRQHGRTKSFSVFPYAEDVDAFRARVLGVVDGIVDRHLGQRVVVTCHSGVINAVLASVLDSPYDIPVRVHHTSISTCRGADTRRSVLVVNDFAHVLPFQTPPGDSNL